MSSPLPPLLITEATLKLLSGLTFLFSPRSILTHLSPPPYSPSSLSLIQVFGTQTLAFSIPLFLASRSDRASVGSRRIVYWAMLGREGVLAVALLAKIGWGYYLEWMGEVGDRIGVGNGERERLLEEGIMRDFTGEEEDKKIERRKLRRGLWLWFAELAPFVVARIWILSAKREWFE